MPIDIIARDSEGHLTRAFRLGDGRGNYLLSRLSEVEGEMPADDFFHGAGLPFFPNFILPGRFVYNSETYRGIKERLANFVGQRKITDGPYYVHEVKEGNMATLAIVLLQKADIRAFAEMFPEWQRDELMEDLNRQTAIDRAAEGWKAECPRLRHWMAGVISGRHRDGVPCHCTGREPFVH